jgi:hypothetical protein
MLCCHISNRVAKEEAGDTNATGSVQQKDQAKDWVLLHGARGCLMLTT